MKISNPSEGNVIATTDPVVLDALAAGAAGALGTVSDGGHRHGVDLSDFLVLAGAQATEASSTSTSPVDLLALTGLTIPASRGFLLVGLGRKAAGAANDVHFGLSINGTVVAEAGTDTTTGIWHSATFNEAESGVFFVVVGPRVTNYLRVAVALSVARGAASGRVVHMNSVVTADIPNAEVTSIEIRGLTDDALVEMFCDEVRVYELPTT